MFSLLLETPRVHPAPTGRGIIRHRAEDFVVEELLGFEPDGVGGHAWLLIRKRNANTEWLANQLAAFADVKPVDVGYAGMKDRHALTTQWFSVKVEGKSEPEWQALAGPDIEFLQITRHGRKLRTGALRGNQFRLQIRDFSGDRDELAERLVQLQRDGMANYFGKQRFGLQGQNLQKAWTMLTRGRRERDRHRRGLYLSAARSALFNQVLGRRVLAGTWNNILVGERAMLDGSQATFAVAVPRVSQHEDHGAGQDSDDGSQGDLEATVLARARQLDIHPTGPLWGRGDRGVDGDVLALEMEVLEPYLEWREGLEKAGLNHERRALRVALRTLAWSLAGSGNVEINFDLPRGSYATELLAELFDIVDPHRR